MKKTVIAAALVAILTGAGFCWSKYDEWFFYPTLRAHVNDRMKDPASTQYRNEFMTKDGWLCGEMNSKNGMGAYVGFSRYISGSATDVYLDGYGYVGDGKAVEVASDRLIELLDKRIAVMKRLNETGIKKTQEEIDQLATAKLFEEKWQQICAKT